MKKVRTEDAVGMVLGHDLTKIIPGEFKGAAFKKGDIIKPEDIDVLKSMGKDHIFILELGPDQIHENEAAVRIALAAAGKGIDLAAPHEGKVNFTAQWNGLLKVSREVLELVNSVEHVSLATLHNNTEVRQGQLVAGTRIIPLVTEVSNIEMVEEICRANGHLISVKPFESMKVGVVITGNEVFYGRIEDKFAPVLREKMKHYACELVDIIYAPDDASVIKDSIMKLISVGAEAIVTAGGMSVDPDDVTPEGIRSCATEVVSYGAPVLPGAMFMLAYRNDIPIMGMPACGMYHRTTIFDLVFVRILAGEKLEEKDIAVLGYGGLCMNCNPCTYPKCSFGKA
ncbi:MAG: molybdopterin-binding protein [Bacillota bacterium]